MLSQSTYFEQKPLNPGETLAALTRPEGEDVVTPIHRLIKSVQQRAAPDDDCKFRQALAHLWAAADLLETAPR
ncbi:MAG: hypothetical protein U1A78_21200 [Polyangia bacterium]